MSVHLTTKEKEKSYKEISNKISLFLFFFILTFFLSQARLCALSLTENKLLQKIYTKMASLSVAQGRFSQIAPNGQESTGRFWLHKPGRIRFEYDHSPSPTLITDGLWVVIQEPGSLTQRYPLKMAPLSILLNTHLDHLSTHVFVKNIQRKKGCIYATYASKDIPGTLTLILEKDTLDLKGWVMEDVQGLHTTIYLHDVDYTTQAKPDRFFSVKEDPLNMRPFSTRRFT